MKILATSWHPGGANTIVPVIKKLMAEGKVDVTVVGHEFSEPIFEKAGIPFQTVQNFGLDDISAMSMEKLLKMVLPNLVLTGTSGQEGKRCDVIEQTVTVAAKNLGITSVAILDYWAGYLQRFTDERTGERLALLPDYVAIIDEIAEREMLAEGFPKEKLVVTGNPHFDNLSARAKNFTETQRREIWQKIGLSCQTLFFFAGNGFSSDKKNCGFWDMDILELIAQVLPNLPDIGVAARLHPRMPEEDKLQISEFIGKAGEKIRLVDDIDSQTLALAADLTIVANTTVGLEAVYMGKPVISLQPGLIGEDILLVSKEGFIPVGYDKETCKDLLRKAMDPSYRSQIVKQCASFTTDGKATERVVKLVYSLLKV